MKTKSILCLALILSSALAAFSIRVAYTNSLRVVVIPYKTEVCVNETFKVALRVENPTTTNQTMRVMSCSWDGAWESSNTNISWHRWVCTKNGPVNVEIPPGGAYTNELQMFIFKPISEKTLSFRMGFTPIDSNQTFWSDVVRLRVAPQVTAAEAKAKLRVVKVDSEETNNQEGYGENAVDGNPNTYWHTQWQGNNPALPHEIIIELIPPSIIKGFAYLPRQDVSDHGTIKAYEFYVSKDGKSFGRPVKKGEFKPGKEEKIETFKPVKCRFIKLRAISEINNLPWTSAAEIRVLQSGEDVSPMPYQAPGLRTEDATIAEPHRVYVVGAKDLAAGRLLSPAKSNSGLYQTSSFAETHEAMRKAKDLPKIKRHDYELRFLEVPSINFCAVWLHAKSDDIIMPLPPTFGRKLTAYEAYSESQIIKVLKPEAKEVMKSPSLLR